ncbi:MAG TPA: anti-sigma factor [Solirubrobacteraceae bacterium]|nr:anti-sigma factor [Solirubrobacteraceae bacterium]
MSRLDDLPPDLRAALSLVLGQHKSYAELGGLLGVERHAVHDRAHAALALLAPRQARELSVAQREQVGEYMLGQLDDGGRLEAFAYLEGSEPARAWARALAGELGPLAPRGLPAIPAAGNGAAHRAADSGSATPATPAVSRRGGAILLGAIAVVAVVAVVLIVGLGGGGGSSPGTSGANATRGSTSTGKSTGKAGATIPSAAATTPSGATGAGGVAGATHSKALPLTPTDPTTTKALGVAYVLSEKGQRAFYVFSKGLPTPASGSFYAVWLEGSSSSPDYPLGSLPPAGSDGLIEGGGPLPSDAAGYTRIVVTVETSHKPTHPGQAVLGGKFEV